MTDPSTITDEQIASLRTKIENLSISYANLSDELATIREEYFKALAEWKEATAYKPFLSPMKTRTPEQQTALRQSEFTPDGRNRFLSNDQSPETK